MREMKKGERTPKHTSKVMSHMDGYYIYYNLFDSTDRLVATTGVPRGQWGRVIPRLIQEKEA